MSQYSATAAEMTVLWNMFQHLEEPAVSPFRVLASSTTTVVHIYQTALWMSLNTYCCENTLMSTAAQQPTPQLLDWKSICIDFEHVFIPKYMIEIHKSTTDGRGFQGALKNE
jgi:hypothetical protein